MSQRIHSIDAVRALALLGILLAHAHGRFNYYTDFFPPFATDALYDWVYEHFFTCKFFLVFAFLFGLIFFFQMDHAEARGVDFRPRFCWRLVLLAGFGVLHSFFYAGDILMIFAVMGFIPVLLWRVPTNVVAALCALCLLQPVALYHSLCGTPQAMESVAENLRESLGLCWLDPALQESLWETGKWNLCNGIAHSWIYTLCSHRIWALVGMFLLGMLAGRYRIFEQAPARLLRWALIGACIYLPALAGQRYAPLCMKWWEHIGFVIMFVPLAAWALAQPRCQVLAEPLAAIGRCTLTCYITQNIIMAIMLCGFGYGLNPYLSTTAIMNWAFVLYLVQMLFCILWLRSFRYGPFESVWRRLTQLGINK